MQGISPRVVVFDLDGTLAESKQRMTPAMGELLGQLLEKMPVAVMSGAGMPQFQKQFLASVPDSANLSNLYIFPDNAAQCFVYREGKWYPQYDEAFSPEEKARIMTVLNESLADIGLADAPVRVWGERIEDRGAEVAFSPLGQEAPLSDKEEWHKEHNDLRERLHDALNKKLPEFANAMGGLTTIDITRKGITKAYGITRLAELTKVPVNQMLYVGDALQEGGNDSVVIATGVPTHAVLGPAETATLIKSLLEGRGAVA